MTHTFIMFLVSTGHVIVILRYVCNIFLYHNAASEGDVIPSSGGSFIAFIMLLLLNVSVQILVIFHLPRLTSYHVVHHRRCSRDLASVGDLEL